MDRRLTPFQTALDDLQRQDRLRVLSSPGGVDFSSNDYLGLTRHDGIRIKVREALEDGVALGSGGSRLLAGNAPEHENLEAFAAPFFGAEASLFMATGYLANLSLFSCLPARGDVVIFDELIHASAKEGIYASSADKTSFRHNDLDDLRAILKRVRDNGAKRLWIAVESVYSMDGDTAPLSEIIDIADAFDAFVVVDEAHATGIWGPDGRGLSAVFEGRENLIALHTCGKALGQAGALVTLPRVLKHYLINRSRGFIYTTAPSPLTAIAVKAALEVVEQEPERRERLHTLVGHARQCLTQVFGTIDGSTQILPLILGSDRRAVDTAKALQDAGFDIRAVRPPTVAEGTARLRMSVTLNANKDDINRLAATLGELVR